MSTINLGRICHNVEANIAEEFSVKPVIRYIKFMSGTSGLFLVQTNVVGLRYPSYYKIIIRNVILMATWLLINLIQVPYQGIYV